MPAPSASGFDLLCRNTTIATADRQQTNATTITALVVARMPKFIVGPQPVGTSRVFPQPARKSTLFTGALATYAYWFQVCGFPRFAAAMPAGSGVSQRPWVVESLRNMKWERLLSESKSWPVKCRGLQSVPVHDCASPKGRLVQVSTRVPETLLSARLVPSQSLWSKYVVLLAYVATCNPCA